MKHVVRGNSATFPHVTLKGEMIAYWDDDDMPYFKRLVTPKTGRHCVLTWCTPVGDKSTSRGFVVDDHQHTCSTRKGASGSAVNQITATLDGIEGCCGIHQKGSNGPVQPNGFIGFDEETIAKIMGLRAMTKTQFAAMCSHELRQERVLNEETYDEKLTEDEVDRYQERFEQRYMQTRQERDEHRREMARQWSEIDPKRRHRKREPQMIENDYGRAGTQEKEVTGRIKVGKGQADVYVAKRFNKVSIGYMDYENGMFIWRTLFKGFVEQDDGDILSGNRPTDLMMSPACIAYFSSLDAKGKARADHQMDEVIGQWDLYDTYLYSGTKLKMYHFNDHNVPVQLSKLAEVRKRCVPWR